MAAAGADGCALHRVAVESRRSRNSDVLLSRVNPPMPVCTCTDCLFCLAALAAVAQHNTGRADGGELWTNLWDSEFADI